VRSEGIESAEIKTQSGPVVKTWNEYQRTRLTQVLDLLAEGNPLKVHASELEVRPPSAPTIGLDLRGTLLSGRPSQTLQAPDAVVAEIINVLQCRSTQRSNLGDLGAGSARNYQPVTS
jgi:hypothetical protein